MLGFQSNASRFFPLFALLTMLIVVPSPNPVDRLRANPSTAEEQMPGPSVRHGAFQQYAVQLALKVMKFLVVDDHALVRDGLRHVVQSLDADARVLEAGNATEAYAVIEAHPDIDLALIDLKLPGVDGYALMQELHKRNDALPIAILSGAANMESIGLALKNGAVGFIPKSSQRKVMLQALRLILSGGIYIPPQALGLAGTDLADEPSRLGRNRIGGSELTERQRQVLVLLAQGKPNKIIASELNISEGTVKAHVTDIMRALGVTNRAQAAVAARQLGIG